MTSPFLYDFKRTLTSKSVLVAMGAMILLALIIYPDFLPNAPYLQNSAASSNTSQVFAFYDSSGYHFIALAWNPFGEPLSGTRVKINVTVSASEILQGSGITNSSGLTEFTIPVPANNGYSLNLSVTTVDSAVLASSVYAPFSSGVGPDQTVSLFTAGRYTEPSTPTIVIDSKNSSARDILVSWAGSQGAPPLDYKVWYEFLNYNQPCQVSAFASICNAGPGQPLPGELNQTNSLPLGTLNSYIGVFHAPPQPESNLSIAQGTILEIGLTFPNGSSIPGSANAASNVPETQVYPAVSAALITSQIDQIMVSLFEDIFGLVIPLLAIIATYNVYGKDRVSGVLESVLAQPVTRRGLAISRFASSYAGMSLSILASVAVMYVIAQHFAQSYVDLSIIIFSTVGLLVELAAFIGIMMLLSHLVRSSGTLIALGLGLFLIIDFFQGLIVTLVASALGIQYGTTGFYQISFVSQFADPAKFVALVDTYLTGTVRIVLVGVATGSFAASPNEYGLSVPALIATALVWIIVPLTCFLYLAVKRD